MMIWEKIILFINSVTDRFKQLNVEEKKRLAIICTACFSVILTLAVIMSVKNGAAKERRHSFPEQLQFNTPIPAEELFIPDEPDFLPGVLLDRERREVWTEEDALEFWNDPLRAGEEQWRKKIENAVDEFLETIP